MNTFPYFRVLSFSAFYNNTPNGVVLPSISTFNSKRSSYCSKRAPPGRKRSVRSYKNIKPLGTASTDEDDGKGHPGPIFLANVVTQQYRYRWMVAAISVFVTMTIIVVISVVYSNQ